MKEKISGVALAFVAVAALAVTAPEYPFKGSRRCKACHARKETGDQYSSWKESQHAKAFETLSSEKARKAGAEKGVLTPQTSKDCLKCHATASEVDPKLLRGLVQEEGVSCETCHGPSGHYWRTEIMKDPVKAQEMGLRRPKDETVCRSCHNAGCPCDESTFDFQSRLDKIKHWGLLHAAPTPQPSTSP